jgi:hypothetical protein
VKTENKDIEKAKDKISREKKDISDRDKKVMVRTSFAEKKKKSD